MGRLAAVLMRIETRQASNEVQFSNMVNKRRSIQIAKWLLGNFDMRPHETAATKLWKVKALTSMLGLADLVFLSL